jgi:hypothetical protein
VATGNKITENSYAIAEQPRSASVPRITRLDREGFDVESVVQVVTTLITGHQ